MTASALRGRVVALLLMDDTDQDNPEWFVLYGTVEPDAVGDGGIFLGRDPSQRIPLTAEQLGRARTVSDAQRTIFAPAEFFIPMTMSALPEDADASQYQHTGFKVPEWPQTSLTLQPTDIPDTSAILIRLLISPWFMFRERWRSSGGQRRR
jgi:hypothetical protein